MSKPLPEPDPPEMIDLSDAYFGWIELTEQADGGWIVVRFDSHGGEVERARLEPFAKPVWH